MCKYNEHLNLVTGVDLDSRRRVGRPISSQQAIPVLPDPTTGIWPCVTKHGNSGLKPPITR